MSHCAALGKAAEAKLDLETGSRIRGALSELGNGARKACEGTAWNQARHRGRREATLKAAGAQPTEDAARLDARWSRRCEGGAVKPDATGAGVRRGGGRSRSDGRIETSQCAVTCIGLVIEH